MTDPIDRRDGRTNRRKRLIGAWMVAAVLAVAVPSLHAAMLVRQMDLATLSKNADAIVRASVLDIEYGTIRAGGGIIPTITYRLQVKEAVAGQMQGVFSLTMIGESKTPVKVGGATRASGFSDGMPVLKQGQEYLLFTTRPSKAGLSTTVGLGQGCFSVYTQDKKVMVVNSANNSGLGAVPSGPVEYGRLVRQVLKARATK